MHCQHTVLEAVNVVLGWNVSDEVFAETVADRLRQMWLENPD